jgi:hypothetical protein
MNLRMGAALVTDYRDLQDLVHRWVKFTNA